MYGTRQQEKETTILMSIINDINAIVKKANVMQFFQNEIQTKKTAS